MNKLSVHLAACIAACLLAAPAVLAQPMPPGGIGHPGRMEGPGPGGHPRLAGLDLSEAQRDRVFAILHEAAPQRRELDKAERKAREALREMAGSPQFEQKKAEQHAQALGQAVAGEALLRLRTDARIMAVLTPEQRAQLERAPQRPGRPQPRQELE